MGSSRRASILRRLARLTALARDTVARRQALREKAAAWTTIRAAMADARISPARVKILWPVSEAAGELARLGDSPERESADAGFIASDPVLVGRCPYDAAALARVPRFAHRGPPDFGAALADWHAWALARAAPAGAVAKARRGRPHDKSKAR